MYSRIVRDQKLTSFRVFFCTQCNIWLSYDSVTHIIINYNSLGIVKKKYLNILNTMILEICNACVYWF